MFMKKSKKVLSLNKLVISKLNNPSHIMGGTGADTDDSQGPDCPSISFLPNGCPAKASDRDFECKSNNDIGCVIIGSGLC